jgi:CubicO group peptidase (beta-lactamase class C family)
MNWLRRWLAAMLGAVIAMLSAQAVAAPGLPSPSRVDAIIRQAMRETRTPGVAVVIVHGDRLVLARGYGYADLAIRRPVDPRRTLFRIGSVTKLFTYTLAMQEVEAGRLDLDRDLNAYLGPGTFPHRSGPPITARTVMAHRTGFEDAVMYRLLQLHAPMPTAEAFVHDHVPTRVRPAGLATSYSNYAVSALGLAVARIAGDDYPRLVQRRILGPLAMRHSAVAEPPLAPGSQPFGSMAPPLAADMSVGYCISGERPVAVPYEHIYPAAAPAGSMSATATDMARFMAAYLNGGAIGEGRILKPGTIAAMRRRLYADRPGAPDYAGGFLNQRLDEYDGYSHDGVMNGFRSELLLVPALDLGVFVAANSDSWDGAGDVARSIAMAALPPRPPHRPAGVIIDGSQYAGEYITSRRSYSKLEALLFLRGETVQVEPEGDRQLKIAMPGDTRIWTALSPDLFGDGDDRIMFQRDHARHYVRFYAPSGSHFFERMAWWQRPSTLFLSLAIVAIMAIATLLLDRDGRARRRPWASLIATGALSLPASFLLAYSVFDTADPESWPSAKIIALVSTSYAGLALVPAALTFTLIAGSSKRARVTLVLLTMSITWLLYLLAQWGAFGGAFN